MPFRPYLALPSFVSRRSPLAVAADKAYDSEKVRQRIKDEAGHPQPQQYHLESLLSEALLPPPPHHRDYFCRIEDFATRYDIARNFIVATTLVGVLYWIKL